MQHKWNRIWGWNSTLVNLNEFGFYETSPFGEVFCCFNWLIDGYSCQAGVWRIEGMACDVLTIFVILVLDTSIQLIMMFYLWLDSASSVE